MKAPRRPSHAVKPMRVAAGDASRTSLQEPATITTPTYVGPIGCVRCQDPPCRAVVTEDGAHKPLCPTDAVGVIDQDGVSIDEEMCIGCGLCVLRCPTGAIYFDDRPPAPVRVAVPGGALEEADEAVHLASLDALRIETSPSAGTVQDLADDLSESAFDLTHKGFYSLVAGLFEIAGFQADLGHGGDTSSRFDLLLPDSADSIPVEVKSRTETEEINVKSVQQALENKIIVDSRSYPSRLDSSSLVVGWSYPADRSDVEELIEDIYSTFGISVGLISLNRLYVLALERILIGLDHDRATLSALQGRL